MNKPYGKGASGVKTNTSIGWGGVMFVIMCIAFVIAAVAASGHFGN